MNADEIPALLADVKVPGYTFHVGAIRGVVYLKATYEEPDIDTGIVETQHTRRWLVSPEATKSEIIQTAFKCILTSFEHRAREAFTYKGRRIFGPHYDVEALVQICDDGKLEHRGKP